MANHFKTRHLFSVILNELENQSKRPFLKCFHTRFIIIILKCVLTWFIIIIYNSYGLLYDLSIIPMYASRGQINCFVSNWLFNVMETSLYFIFASLQWVCLYSWRNLPIPETLVASAFLRHPIWAQGSWTMSAYLSGNCFWSNWGFTEWEVNSHTKAGRRSTA